MFLSIFLIFFSSLLLILSFPKPGFSWFIWFSFVPLFFALEKKSKKQAFWLSYLCGFVFWASLIYWISFVTVLGYILLVLYLALYFGLFGLFFLAINYKLSTINLFFIPSLWVALEYLRSHLFTGFGWALLGYTQYKNLYLIQIADITGCYGISFLIVLVNIGIFFIIKSVLKRKILFSLLATCYSLLSIVSVLTYSYWRLNQNIKGEELKVSIIQGNIPQEEKWVSENKEMIFSHYIQLTEQASRQMPDLIIWPETSVPGYLNEELEFQKELSLLATKLDTYLLVGIPTSINEKDYNSAILYSKKGRIVAKYDKVHLVPFGEYFPLGRLLSPLSVYFESGSFSPGETFTIFKLDRVSDLTRYSLPATRYFQFSVLICYEDIFPHLVRKFTTKGAIFLVNITNDAWFGKSSATYQHAQSLVFRSIENRVSSVRVANTGLSCFITPTGKIYGRIKNDKGKELFISGYNTEKISLVTQTTFYKKYGDIFAIICLLMLLIYSLLCSKKLIRPYR